MMQDDYEVTFGTWLRQKLNERGWSQRRLAQMVGASTGMMSGWAGDKRRPEPGNVAKIAAALGVPEEEALTRAGYRQRRDTDMDPRRAEALEMLRQLPLSVVPTVVDFMRFQQAEALRPRRLDPPTVRRSAG